MGAYGQSCVDITLSTLALGGDIQLTAEMLLDNADASATYEITPNSVNCNDIGTPVAVTITGPSGLACTSTVTVVDDTPPVAIAEIEIIVAISNNGTATIFPENIDNGSYDGCSDVTLSLSQTEFGCSDLGETDVSLTVTDAYGNTNQTWTTVIVEDKLSPIILANEVLNVSFDNNGEAEITFDMVEQGSGSYDNCGSITKSLSKTSFTCEDAGEQNVIFTVTDEAGNLSAKVISIIFEDKLKPIPFAINLSTALLSTSANNPIPSIKLYAEDFDQGSYDNCGIVNKTINKDTYTCEDIGENEVIFTVYDAAGNSDFAIVLLNIIDNSVSTESLSCISTLNYSPLENLPDYITPYDVLAGGPYGCDFDLDLSIEDADGNILPNNYISNAYNGQTLTYTVTDLNTDNTCWGTIIVEDAVGNCGFDGDQDIDWPLAQIEVDLNAIDVTDLTPEYLQNSLGFDETDVAPIFTNSGDCFIGFTYDDDVFTTSQNIDKIVRNFTVIDWIVYDITNGNEGLFFFTQVIKNINSSESLICDTLPRSAPEGDCESGHTLEDDVEWPNDIVVADHRITPTELINYSDILPEDAEPNFFGDNADLYTASYQDLVGSLNSEELTINRVWIVERSGLANIEWTYTQEIEVSFADFSNLVAVNTHGSRGVPQVELGNNILTDQFGKAIVEDDFFINPTLSSEPINGLDLVDLYLSTQHILGIIDLNEYTVLVSDLNDDNSISSIDVVRLRKILFGEVPDNIDWKFLNITDNLDGINQVKGHYVAYRSGDVDDSALLPGESAAILEQVDLSFEDLLLNDGESYTIPFYSDAMINTSGIELRLKYDPSIIEITDISGGIFDTFTSWSVDDDNGLLTIIAVDVFQSHFLDGATLFNISATAKENSVLNNGISFSDSYKSLMMDEELNKYSVNGSLENGIALGTNNEDFAAGISVYPNPTVDFINIDLSKTAIVNNYTVTLFDTNGKQVVVQSNTEQISTGDLPTGSYVLVLTSGDSYYSELIQVAR